MNYKTLMATTFVVAASAIFAGCGESNIDKEFRQAEKELDEAARKFDAAVDKVVTESEKELDAAAKDLDKAMETLGDD